MRGEENLGLNSSTRASGAPETRATSGHGPCRPAAVGAPLAASVMASQDESPSQTRVLSFIMCIKKAEHGENPTFGRFNALGVHAGSVVKGFHCTSSPPAISRVVGTIRDSNL
jgi:hypothetical protein